MTLAAIDPGSEQSALCLYDGATIRARIMPNAELLEALDGAAGTLGDELIVEMISSYGMPVGREVFETVLWIGRFVQAWDGPFELIYRRDVKLHVCGSPRAKDANVRQAMIDRFGKPGTKKAPGVTYGLAKDSWQALALAVTAWDRRQLGHGPLNPAETPQRGRGAHPVAPGKA